ncbi:hypothetical protein [Falsirhodobacter sp. alg1]|uniref:hypothetical protein n=1 Tax=Falsirhodobacter sp. alg1 TaxID=1472418 RepID=UPI00128EC588|nr:hypothetical protein [Falsirhodobacter sp. alg1]
MSAVRISFAVITFAGLAACAPAVPDSSYQSYMQSQSGSIPQNPVPQGYQTEGTTQQTFTTEGALAAINSAGTSQATTTATSATSTTVYPAGERPRGNAPNNIAHDTGEMVNVAGHTNISNENSFEAVSAERNIAEDKAFIEQNKSQYVQVQPTAIPARPNDDGPNIVSYALQTSNPRGQQMYSRSSLKFSDSQKQCAKYGTPDQAQIAFLASGGPDRDRENLDPDGDGYACAWDPAPFRAASR